MSTCSSITPTSRSDALIAAVLRVNRRAIVPSVRNRFVGGRPIWRLAKRALRNAGVWPRLIRLKHGEHDWFYSEGDGVAFFYSVFDSTETPARAGCRLLVVPTRGPATTFLSPLFLASQAPVCAIED